MRQRILLSFLIFLLLVPPTVGTPQTSASAQLGFQASTQAPRWTDSYRKEILTKARDGDAGAQFWLGAAYGEGWFGNTDFPEALKWLRRSAARGNPDAQVSLGQMYEHGRGAKQNYKLAAKWCRMAAGHVPDFGGAGQGRNDFGIALFRRSRSFQGLRSGIYVVYSSQHRNQSIRGQGAVDPRTDSYS
jgi:hypothetical protein